MRKWLALLLVALFAFSPIEAMLADKQPTGKLKLEAEAKKVFVGATLQLTVTCDDPEVSLGGVTYQVDKPKLASVDENGLVTAIAPGAVKVTVKSEDGKRSASLNLQVEAVAESVTIKAQRTSVLVDKAITVTASVLPRAVRDQSVIWTSSDENIATVSSKGKIKGIAPGKAIITAASAAFPEILATVEIEVIRLATKVTVSAGTEQVTVGETLALACAFEPDDVSSQAVTYKVDRPKIASVNEDGVVTGIKAGTATITVTAADGSKKSSKITIEVVQPALGVFFEDDTINLGVGGSKVITAEFEPKDVTNKNMTWESDNPDVATVAGTSNKPKVTVHAWGDATITGTTQDGGFTAELYVTGGIMRYAIRLRKAYYDSKDRLHLVFYNESNMDIGSIRIAIKGVDSGQNPITMSDPTAPMPGADEEGGGIEPIDMPKGGFRKDASICNGIVYLDLAPGEELDLHDVTLIQPTEFRQAAYKLSVAITGYTCVDSTKYDISKDHWKWVDTD